MRCCGGSRTIGLSRAAGELIGAGEVPVYFSAASIWEAGIRAAAGKLSAPDDLLRALEADGFVELAIAARHAREATQLAALHRDPFDRMLVAQARSEEITVITADDVISAYGVPVLW